MSKISRRSGCFESLRSFRTEVLHHQGVWYSFLAGVFWVRGQVKETGSAFVGNE